LLELQDFMKYIESMVGIQDGRIERICLRLPSDRGASPFMQPPGTNALRGNQLLDGGSYPAAAIWRGCTQSPLALSIRFAASTS